MPILVMCVKCFSACSRVDLPCFASLIYDLIDQLGTIVYRSKRRVANTYDFLDVEYSPFDRSISDSHQSNFM